jgi:hypothetical protein
VSKSSRGPLRDCSGSYKGNFFNLGYHDCCISCYVFIIVRWFVCFFSISFVLFCVLNINWVD